MNHLNPSFLFYNIKKGTILSLFDVLINPHTVRYADVFRSYDFAYLSHFWLATVQDVLQADWQDA
jgi:transposase-like protein